MSNAWQGLTKASDFTSGKTTLPAASIMRPGGSGTIRDVSPTLWFSILQPVKPSAPADYRPRQRAYAPGENIIWQPGADKAVGYDVLRALADSWDLLRIIIEQQKDRLCNTEFELRAKAQTGESNRDRKQRSMKDKTLQQLQAFWEYPDGVHQFRDWLHLWLEDMIVIDAVALYLERDKSGKISSIHPIDGATINRTLTDQGLTPPPPSVAHQQVVYGTIACDFTTDDLVFYMRNERTCKRYGYSPVERILLTINVALRRQNFQLEYYCYSDDTEFFTRLGWKRMNELSRSDEFATRVKDTGEFEWQRATELFSEPYSGKMVHFKNRSIDLLVTPNHRMLVDTLPRALGHGRPSKKAEQVIEAASLALCSSKNTGIVQTANWVGKEIVERTFGARGKNKTCKTVRMTGDQYCAFMGMYLAEGSCRRSSVLICQPRDARGSHQAYAGLLQEVFGREVCHDGKQFEVGRESLVQFLRKFGHAEDKFIPDDIREATPRQLGIFWRYYYLGDGRAADDGRTEQAFTSSRKLADHLCEILQKIGRAVTTNERMPGVSHVGNRAINSRGGWTITAGERKATKQWVATVEDYSGEVVCVTVPNSFVYVRRNGRCAWSGNTSGNMPEALCFLPSNVTIDRVKEMQEWFDSVFAGDTAKRRRLSFLPGMGTDTSGKPSVIFPKEVLLKDEMDEWLAKIACFCIGISAQPFLKMMNRASAQQSQETSEEEGQAPYQESMLAVLNNITQNKMGFSQYEWARKDHRELDVLKQAQADALNVGKIETVNEIREARGLDPRPEANAGKLGEFTQTGFIEIDAVQDEADEQDAAAGKQVDAKSKPVKPNGAVKPNGKSPAEKVMSAAIGFASGTAVRGFIETLPDSTLSQRVQTLDTVSKAKKKPQFQIGDLTRDSQTAAAELQRVMAKSLAVMRAKAVNIASKVNKLRKSTSDDLVNAIMQALGADFAQLPAEVQPLIEQAIQAGISEGVLQVDLNDTALISSVNKTAMEWAHERAAELVGMKWDAEGVLVTNPNAEWAISETTRDDLRAIIEDAFSKETPRGELVDAIADAGTFSDSRAEMIARTEVSLAQREGNLETWLQSGMVEDVNWVTSEDENVCDECDALEAGSPYPIDDVPDMPHPRCQCNQIANTITEPGDEQ